MEASAWSNVYLHPLCHRMPLVHDWAGEAMIRIENYGCIMQAYGSVVAREVHSAILLRVHRAIELFGVATPDGDGDIEMLLWDAAAIGGNPDPAKAAAWLADLLLLLTLEPVATGSGPVHAIVSASIRKGFGPEPSSQSGSAVQGESDTGLGLPDEKWRTYRSDMAAVSPLLQALGGSHRRRSSGSQVEVGVFWRPIAVSGQASCRPMFEGSLGLVDDKGQTVGLEAVMGSAERLDMVHLIDRYLVSRVTAELLEVPASLTLFVSMSAASLCSEEVWSELLASFECRPEAASRLVVELRDTSGQLEWSRVAKVVSGMRRFGAKISIGNFGTGRSSLRHLFALKPDFVTVDTRFLQAAGLLDADDDALVHLVGLARSLGARVIIDGVDCEPEAVRAGSVGAALLKGAWIGPSRICRPWATGCSH